MASELKQTVARGTSWTLGEKVATALVQFVVRVLILRLLMPDDLKVLALLMAFGSLALVVVDSGFSQMLVRKQHPSDTDYKSVFVFNLLTSLVLYGVLTLSAPWMAEFYAMPAYGEVAALFFLMIPLNALCVIQQTLCARQFRFALLSKVLFAAQVISGVAAVGLAWAGCGVWALVAQQVLLMAVRAVLLWWLGAWNARGKASFGALRAMAPYSFSLLTTDLVNAFYNKVPQLFLGKMYADATLGYYDQAVKLKDLPVQSAMQSVQQVTFPALARIADEQPKFGESLRQVLMVVAFGIVPVMLGMAAVAEDMFAVLLGEKWMPTVPMFEVLCLAGLFTPMAMMAYNVLKVKAEGKTIVRLEIVKKGVMTLLLAVSIPHSVEAVVWALVASAAFDCVATLFVALPLAQLAWGRMLRPILPIIAAGVLMYDAVGCVKYLLADPSLVRLLVEIAVGAAIYLGMAWLFRFEALTELLQLIRKKKVV